MKTSHLYKKENMNQSSMMSKSTSVYINVTLKINSLRNFAIIESIEVLQTKLAILQQKLKSKTERLRYKKKLFVHKRTNKHFSN